VDVRSLVGESSIASTCRVYMGHALSAEVAHARRDAMSVARDGYEEWVTVVYSGTFEQKDFELHG